MASKRKSMKKRGPNQLPAVAKPGEDEESSIERTILRPTVHAAVTLKAYDRAYADLDVVGLMDALSEQSQAATDGDLSRAETMLTAQAHTLDAIFNTLAQRAATNMHERLGAFETYLKLALRAQSQCRATVEALSEMKQPRSVAFVGQANIAQGHQQVNNAPSRAGEFESEQSKVLEQNDGERLDTRTASKAGGVDSSVETVEAIHRAKNR